MSREGGARERSQNSHRYVEDTGESLKFLVIYVLLPMTVMLVSCGCPGFKLVMALLLTFGSKSKLLHILDYLSGVAISCKLIQPFLPYHTHWLGFTGCGSSVLTHFLEWVNLDDYLFSGGGLLTGAHLSPC